MAKQTNNPLSGHFRSPKLYTQLPSLGKFYSPDVVVMPDNGELPVFPMTAKDELIMRNPDALLNGEAVSQVIKSCVPAVKNAKELLSNDVDALLLAIQGASYGNDVAVSAECPKCKKSIDSTVNVDEVLQSMNTLEEAYDVKINDLTITLKPFTYTTTIKAGIASFQSTRSLQSMADLPNDLDRLRVFNENFVRMASVNFDIVVDSVYSIAINRDTDEEVIVTDRAQITEYLENCESHVGKKIEEKIAEIGAIGIVKKGMFNCEECNEQFESPVAFDPVNFSMAS